MAQSVEPPVGVEPVDEQQPYALLFGVVLIALGVADYVGIGVNDGEFLGVFEIPPTVNLVHLATGLLGVVLSRYAGGGTLFDKLGGVIYLTVSLTGSVAALRSDRGINWATNVLHLLLAVAVGSVGFGVGEANPR